MPNTLASLIDDLRALGPLSGRVLMVHSSLGQVGWTVGGAVTVVRALVDAVGPEGTLVMPAESPMMADPATWNDHRVQPSWFETIREHMPVFDPATTPTTMGAVPEAFRTFPGTLRSDHPLVSVCARGRQAERVVAEHVVAFGEGRGTPFEKLYELDGLTLLLGVGFDRCTQLHFAESLVAARRTTTSRFPAMVDGARVWMEVPDMASDHGRLFPTVGRDFEATGAVTLGQVGEAEARLFATRALVDFARAVFEDALLLP